MLTRNNDQWRPVSCVPGLAAGAGAGGAGGAGGEAQGVGGDVVVDVDIAQQLARWHHIHTLLCPANIAN